MNEKMDARELPGRPVAIPLDNAWRYLVLARLGSPDPEDCQ